MIRTFTPTDAMIERMARIRKELSPEREVVIAVNVPEVRGTLFTASDVQKVLDSQAKLKEKLPPSSMVSYTNSEIKAIFPIMEELELVRFAGIAWNYHDETIYIAKKKV
mmetsp:Transcript_17801/g.35906  ORF Transcript_17801/g.35906 Transcript_17801/m.35906 type:complete len:109 (-) Transcript_17801:272-598(-)